MPGEAARDGTTDHRSRRKKQKLEHSNPGMGQENTQTGNGFPLTIQSVIQSDLNQTFEEQAKSTSSLRLIKMMRNREVPNERKIQAAFMFVQMEQHRQEISANVHLHFPPHLFASLSEYVQTQISTSCKVHQLHPVHHTEKHNSLIVNSMIPAHMDARYWLVMKWCLVSGTQWKAGSTWLGVIQAVSCILDEADILLSRDGLPMCQLDLGYGRKTLTTGFLWVLLDVVKLLFTDNEGSFRPKLEVWVSSIRSCLNLSVTMCMGRDKEGMFGDGSKALFQLILFLCRGFAGFSRASPNPRKVFISVIERLLDHLLSSLEHLSGLENQGLVGISAVDVESLLTAIKDILKFTLFHPFHLEGYQNVCTLSRQGAQSPNNVSAIILEEISNTKKATSASTAMLSYHKLFFEQLDLFIEEEKVSTMGSLAWIFRIYVREMRDQVSLCSVFAVFAELLSPLIWKFANIHPSLSTDKTESLFTVKSLLTAINRLLVVAIDEQVYVATQDTPSLTHLNYLKTVAKVLVHSISSPLEQYPVASPGCHWNEEAACLLMVVLKEVLLGVSHIFELEHRALEDDLHNIWKALLTVTTLQFAMAKKHRNKLQYDDENVDTSVNLASQVLQIFSELRQIDQPIFSLCNFLRHHPYPDQRPSLDKLQCRALTSIFLSPRFLIKLATVMKEVPAGQTAVFVGLLKEDLEETLKFVKEAVKPSFNNCRQSWKAAIKALTEISICAIENTNVTPSNGIQVEAKLKALIGGAVFETICHLVDGVLGVANVLADFTDLCSLSFINKSPEMSALLSAGQAPLVDVTAAPRTNAFVVLSWEFILRVYVSVRLLRRKCISLMPHKHAKLTCTDYHDFVMSIELGEISIAAHFSGSEGFFSLARKGVVSMREFFCCIEKLLWEASSKEVEYFLYTLDCIAMLCLFDVKKELKTISFLLTERELRKAEKKEFEDSLKDEQAGGLIKTHKQCAADRRILRRHRKKLMQEASFLANHLTKWIASIQYESEPTDQSLRWNEVISSLDKQTLPVARWSLLCQNITVWSEFASKNDLITFFQFMVGRTLLDKKEDTNMNFRCNIFSVTKHVLSNESFYEQEGVRELFLHVLSQEILETLSLFEADFSLDSAVSYIESVCGNATQECATANGVYCSRSADIVGWGKCCEFSDDDAENRKLTKCISLLKVLVQAPKGFSNISSSARFMSFITELESLTLSCALKTHCQGQLNMANASSPTEVKSFKRALDLLIASRRSLESLILHEDPSTASLEGSYLASAMLHSTCSMYWPLLSVHAATQCLYNFAIENSDDEVHGASAGLLTSYLSCTTGLFTLVSQNLFKELSGSLLLRFEEQLPAARGVTIPDPLFDLVNTLMAQLGKCSDLVKVESSKVFAVLSRQGTKDSGNEKENTLKEYPFGTFSVLGAISTVLWSFTSTLECLDEKCHSDKEGNTKWVGQLPNRLLNWIIETETFVIHGLVDLLVVEENVRKDSASGSGKGCSLDAGKASVFQEKDGSSDDYNAETSQDGHVADIRFSESNAMTYDDGKRPSEPSTANALDEQANTSVQPSGHFMQVHKLQLSMIKMMLSGKLDIHMWMLGELFMAMAAIVKLKSLFHSPNVVNSASELSSQEWTAPTQLHVGVAVRILQEVVDVPQISGQGCLTLLAGILKYLESIGSYLPYARPTLSSIAFVDLVQLQIVLNGVVLSKIQTGKCLTSLVELKASIQSCFKAFMKRPIGLHFHLALQTIEHSLLTVQVRRKGENNDMKACFGSLPSCSILLGGIECLLLLLDSVSGTKRLQILSKYTRRYLATIFHLIRKSQHWLNSSCHSRVGLLMGIKTSACYSSGSSLNPSNQGIILLKCVQLLIKFSSRKAIFPMRACHVAQAIICPSDLFKQFYHRNLHKEKLTQSIFTASDWPVIKRCGVLIPDDRVLLELYTECCRLLRNLLRHRTRECGHCVSLLGESLRALLFFLEVMDLSFEQKQSFSELNKQSSVQCAIWLRRVYEEIAEHKNSLDSYITHFLSDYICVVSGCGITIKGLSREVEAFLRPGALALLDICSKDNLQQLHAVLGEGPRRTTLTALRHDYEQHFKYTGKV